MARRVPLHDFARAIQVVEEDGAVILTGFSSKEEVDKVNQDSAPVIEKVFEQRVHEGVPPGTARCYHLFGTSPTAREVWLQQPALRKMMSHFLGTTTPNWNGDNSLTTEPIISAAVTMAIGPGQEAQTLHRDDFIWQYVHVESLEGKGYIRGRDLGLGMIVAGCQVTRENGATMFVPGSHLWGHERRPKPGEAIPAEMDIGETLFFLSSTAHGGGNNTTHGVRLAHGFFFCRSWLKPEVNQHMFWTKEEVQTWSIAAQKQAGCVLDNPFLGHCNEGNPVDHFRAVVGGRVY